MIAVNVALFVATFYLGREILLYVSAEKAKRPRPLTVKSSSGNLAEDGPQNY